MKALIFTYHWRVCSRLVSLYGFRDRSNSLLRAALILIFLGVSHFSFAASRYWIASSSSNWNNTANWSATSGGTGGASVPGSSDVANFDANGLGTCVLDMAPTINGLTISGYTANIDLSGFTLTISGSSALTFSSGTINNTGASASVVLSSTGAATFGGTTVSVNISGTAGSLTFSGGSTFNGTVTLSAANVLLNGTTSSVNTFNGTTTLTKTGTGNDYGTGGNRFNGTTTLKNTATSGTFESANNYYDIFNGDLTLTCSNSGASIPIADVVSGTQFNGNIIVNSSGGDISFGNGGSGSTPTATLAEGKTITAGTFTSGVLILANFTQGTVVGGTAQTLTLTGTAALHLGAWSGNAAPSSPISTFNGAVTFKAPQIYLNGSTYNSTTYIEKTGGSTNLGHGSNVFNGTTTLVNSGSASLKTANSKPDTFNGVLTLTNSGSSDLSIADKAAGNVINNNVFVNSTAGNGVAFGGNSPATVSLASGKTISVGTSFTTGYLGLYRFTQLGSTAQTLTLTGTAILAIGPSSTFNGNVTFKSPQVYLQGCTYNGTTYIEKTGATSNLGSGGNTFNGTTTLVDSGSGYFATAFSSPDIFNGDLTATNTGSAWVALSDNATGTQFNGNIIVNSTNGTASAGVTFGNGPGSSMTCTLAAGKTISVGGIGFSAGRLRLRGFIQSGATPQTLTLTGTAILNVGNLSTFNGALTFKSPQLYLDGATFNGTAYLEKTGATDNLATLGSSTFNSTATIVNSGSGYLRTNGGHTFNGTTTIISSGSNDVLLELTTASTYNGDVTFTNSGSSRIYPAYAGANAFNGNIIVNSTAGIGITFCASTGTATLANTKTISVGGSGFSVGTLTLQRFTQVGSTPQTMTFTGTGILDLGVSSTYNGAVTFKAPQVLLDGSTYNGTAYLEKTGAIESLGNGNNIFNSTTSIVNSGTGNYRTKGGNTFNGVTTITDTGSGDILLELNAASTYNNDVTFTNSGSSYIRAAYIGANAFNGNIYVNSSAGIGIYFSESASGSATLASGKTISVSSSFTSGTLLLQRFTQTGATSQSLAFTGTGSLSIGPTVVFNGNVNFISPQVYLNGGTYNGTAYIEKSGATLNGSNGGNTFNGIATIVNSGSAVFRLAGSSGDTFNQSVTFTQSSTGALQPAYSGTNYFYGDITINSAAALTFAANTGSVQLSGSANQTISSPSSIPIIKQLVVNKTSSSNTVTLSSPVTIGSSATLTTGVINTSASAYLNFAAGSSYTGGSSSCYIDGPVRKTGNTAFTFPTGDNSIYRTIAISAPSGGTDAFTAQYFDAAQTYGDASTYSVPLYTVSSCEYWILDRSVGTSNVSITLSWNTADCTGTYIVDPSTLVVAHWNGSAWVSEGNGGTTGSASTGTIVSGAAVTSFSPFTLGSSSGINPLPVKFASFGCSKTESGTVQLHWVTASEQNSDYFSIERSKDGLSFQSVGTREAAGNSVASKSYFFEDKTPYSGKAYYRLKQVDLDGKSDYSEVCYVNNESEDVALTLYPNPTNNIVYLDLRGVEPTSVSLFDNRGHIVSITPEYRDEATTLNLSGLPEGFYVVQVNVNRKVFYEKIVVRR